MIAAFTRNSRGDPDVIELARPHLPRVMSAIIVGAQHPGTAGDADRTRLFRMMGLSWADPPRVGDKRGEGAASITVLAERLARAQSRVAGRSTVTLTQSVTVEAKDDEDGALALLSTEQAR